MGRSFALVFMVDMLLIWLGLFGASESRKVTSEVLFYVSYFFWLHVGKVTSLKPFFAFSVHGSLGL